MPNENGERMTYKDRHGDWAVGTKNAAACWNPGLMFEGAAIDKFAAYEDAMPLDRCQELAKVDGEGRLYICPFKIGQKVFIMPNYRAYWDEIEETTITGIAWYPGGWQLVTSACLCYMECDIGKRGIFLTRAEAEVALTEKAKK